MYVHGTLPTTLISNPCLGRMWLARMIYMARNYLSSLCRSMRRRQLLVLLFVLVLVITGFHAASWSVVQLSPVKLSPRRVNKFQSAHALGVTVADDDLPAVRGCPLVSDKDCPDSENIKFFLYTRLNPSVPQLIVGANVSSSNFNASNPTKIILHGFNSDVNIFALVNMRKAYLQHSGDFNVVAVDWGGLSQGSFLCYPTAIQNGKHVGECCAHLVQSLLNAGASDVHVIGFSLGAHVASFVANHLRPYRLKRITGLDPAMPLFVTVSNDQKLDAGDAQYVDVFHTNAFVQGKIERSGHVDFYFNGGSRQPGCGDLEIGDFGFGCSHVRSAVYFAESITSPRGFWGWSCPSYFAYVIGFCRPKTPDVIAGDHVVINSTQGFFLVRTASKTPYALGRQM